MTPQVREALKTIREFIEAECTRLSIQVSEERGRTGGSYERATYTVLRRCDTSELQQMVLGFGEALNPEFDQLAYTTLFWTVYNRAKKKRTPERIDG